MWPKQDMVNIHRTYTCLIEIIVISLRVHISWKWFRYFFKRFHYVFSAFSHFTMTFFFYVFETYFKFFSIFVWFYKHHNSPWICTNHERRETTLNYQQSWKWITKSSIIVKSLDTTYFFLQNGFWPTCFLTKIATDIEIQMDRMDLSESGLAIKQIKIIANYDK